MELAFFMQAKDPLKKDWQYLRFSNEIYFGYGLEDQLQIIRKLGTHYRHNNLEHCLPLPKEDKNHHHKHC